MGMNTESGGSTRWEDGFLYLLLLTQEKWVIWLQGMAFNVQADTPSRFPDDLFSSPAFPPTLPTHTSSNSIPSLGVLSVVLHRCANGGHSSSSSISSYSSPGCTCPEVRACWWSLFTEPSRQLPLCQDTWLAVFLIQVLYTHSRWEIRQ